jgi:hypothetical protein
VGKRGTRPRVDVRFGSEADMAKGPTNVCFTPESGHQLSARGCPLSAKGGLMHRSNLVVETRTAPIRISLQLNAGNADDLVPSFAFRSDERAKLFRGVPLRDDADRLESIRGFLPLEIRDQGGI